MFLSDKLISIYNGKSGGNTMFSVMKECYSAWLSGCTVGNSLQRFICVNESFMTFLRILKCDAPCDLKHFILAMATIYGNEVLVTFAGEDAKSSKEYASAISFVYKYLK